MQNTCKIDGCDRPHYAKGLCKRHWQNTPAQVARRNEYDKNRRSDKAFHQKELEENRIRMQKRRDNPRGRAELLNAASINRYPTTTGKVTIERVAQIMSETHCPRCGLPYDKGPHKLHIDHILPLSRGGSNTDDNIQGLCADCNHAKRDKTEAEFDEAIRRWSKMLDN